MTIVLGSLTLILFSRLRRQCGQYLMRKKSAPRAVPSDLQALFEALSEACIEVPNIAKIK